jgi:ubiquinone/menaquinone biosynthesis C-methylase UbiE
MDGWVARWYARSRKNDIEQFRGQASAVALRLKPGSRVLEVAPGPGLFSIELAKLADFKITGLDISETFVAIASKNARIAGVNVDFQAGNAAAMPFNDCSFDFIYCSAAFKNFSEPVRALDEMHRVLRPEGEAVIVDLRKDVATHELDAYLKESGRSGFDAWLTGLIFRHMLVKRAYTDDQFDRIIKESRFGTASLNMGPIGFEARFTKTPGSADVASS